ncbi:MAG: hypothetical protein ACRCVT_10805 [Leadbetterella sp.]
MPLGTAQNRMRPNSLFALLFVLVSCHSESTDHHITTGFYHWKTQYKLTKQESQALQQQDYLYLRFFDIVLKNKRPFPTAVLDLQTPPSKAIIPVIYVDHVIFYRILPGEINTLAQNTATLVNSISKAHHISFKEIQIDCDWTKTTKDSYFYFLESLKKHLVGIELSVTLRLHQIKYSRTTGVPPVKKGILMCYNMADWRNSQTPNSILDTRVLKQYKDYISDYPLAMDLAMPIFHWAIVYQAGKPKGILKGFQERFLQNKNSFEVLPHHTYICKKDATIQSSSFKKGDFIRHESVPEGLLEDTTRGILNLISNRDIRIVYFDLQEQYLQNYSIERFTKSHWNP